MLIKVIKHSNSKNLVKAVAIVVFTIIMVGTVFIVDQAHTAIDRAESGVRKTILEEKIEKYKKFKGAQEDKDFRLKGIPVNRTEQRNGDSSSYFFNVYHIVYGITEDNFREYNDYSKQIVRTPIHPSQDYSPVCQSGLYLEERIETQSFPEITCLTDAQSTYPISLILKTFSEEEMESIVLIYQFNDGDVDIRFSFEKGRDKTFVEGIFKRLRDADELHDAQRPEPKMQPIIPTENQRITAIYMDEDKDGEPESVFLPYCINGSYFDQDPYNNSFQVGLKYKLVTRKDLAGKSQAEKKALEDRLGLWMWDKPNEILASFSESPGPDVVFYDIGKVVDSVVVDARPDGKFDRYEFLF